MHIEENEGGVSGGPRHGQPEIVVTDRLRAYGAAMNEIGNGAMARFRDIKTLRKFASVHASIHNHFNLDRHLTKRDDFKKNRSAALAEWWQLVA